MGRCDFGRTSLPQPDDGTIYLPAWGATNESSSVIDNPNEIEVHFTESPDARRVSVCSEWHEKERELEVIVGFNQIKADALDSLLKNTTERYGTVKTLTITGATANMRGLCHRTWLEKSGFKRVPDRSRSTWSFSLDLEQAVANRRKRPAVAEANRRRAKEKQMPEVEMIDTAGTTLAAVVTELEASKERLRASNLTVPKKLTDEIERAKSTLSISEDLEREREALKHSPEYLAIEAEVRALRGGR